MLKVTLLGTGGTQPLPDRALAAAAVTVGGRSPKGEAKKVETLSPILSYNLYERGRRP